MPKDEPLVKIVNVVASASLKHGIDLNAVVKAFPTSEYRPKQFPGVIFRMKNPKTATLIFSSGKMICTGAVSEREARRALKRVVRKLKKEGIIIVGRPNIKIENMVASASLGGKVDLVGLYKREMRTMRGRILYEPEQFPGLMYRMKDPRAVILIFSSGKLVCTGSRTEEDIHQAISKLHEKLEKNRIYREKVHAKTATALSRK